MKVYEAIFEEGRTEGVYALSVVNDPAMEDMFVAFDKHPKEVMFAAVDEDKKLLLGAALIPDKKIYRNVDGNEFYITMSAQTIEKLAHAFLKNGYQKNSTLEHEVKLQDMSIVETWIVEDSTKDKSNLYGKEYPKGTWVAMMKVDNNEVWQLAKQGEIRGFSIEALLGMTEINFKSNITMNKDEVKSLKDELLDGFKAIFNSKKEDEKVELNEDVKLEEPMIEDEPKADFDMAGFKSMLEEFLANFKKDIDAKVDVLVKENAELKTELSKQPESEPVKILAKEDVIKTSKSLVEFLNNKL